jgi:hypothetical protein
MLDDKGFFSNIFFLIRFFHCTKACPKHFVEQFSLFLKIL